MWHDGWLVASTGRPLAPLEVRSFRWLISSDLVPRGYENGQAPWRLLVRSYLVDLPGQLTEENSQQSIFSWRERTRHVGRIHHRKQSDNAPPEITCGGRYVFSQYGADYNNTLYGHWLVIVYLWATDATWLSKANLYDLVSHDSVTG